MDIHELRANYARWVRQTQPDADVKLQAFWRECRQHDFDLFVQLVWIAGVTAAVILAELVICR